MTDDKCTKQIVEAIISILDDSRLEIMKEEKGSMHRRMRYEISTMSLSYVRLAEELLGKDAAKDVARYVYFNFEQPAMSYLGFPTSKPFLYNI